MFRFDAASGGHQDGGESQRNAGQDDQRKCDHSLFHQTPDLGEFVAAAETFHPGDHDAGGGPEREQRSGDQQADGARRTSLQIGQGRAAFPREGSGPRHR